MITNLRMELFEALLLPRLVVCMASWTESECWGKNTDPRCEGAIIDDWFCEHIKHAPHSTNIVLGQEFLT